MKPAKKILNILYTFLSVIALSSCLDTGSESTIDYDWKNMNEQAFAALPLLTEENMNDPGADTLYYRVLTSTSGNGNVKWRKSYTMSEVSTKIASDGKAEFTDSVQVRYEGWFFLKDGTRYVFDSTENPVYGSTTNPNKMPRGFMVKSVIAGWMDILMDMKTGEEREVWIPYTLGYGAVATTSIPAFTTLTFRIKLLKIVQMPGKTS